MAIIRVRDENGKILEIPAFAGPVGGHYKPVVEQTASDTVKMSFAASRDDMESIDPVEIKLPVPESSQNAAALPMPETATEGQFIVVSAVDENGVVTATEAVTISNAEGVAF